MILHQKQISREIIKISQMSLQEAYDEKTDSLELLDRLDKKLNSINGILVNKDISHISEQLKKLEEINEKQKSLNGNINGVFTGIKDLDNITYGWQKTDLIILAARPGMGKTGLALTYALAAAKKGIGVGFFSLEMGAVQLLHRILAQLSGIDLYKIRHNSLSYSEENELAITKEAISKMPLYVDDTASLTMRELKTKCIRLKREHNIQLIIVDYLQLITPSKNAGTRDQEIGEISRGLKIIAKELDVAVIALSQLSRSVEQRTNKQPLLSDLRESGNIEQDADIVTFVWRPEYYGIERDSEGNDLKGLAEIIIAKHRNGGLGDVRCIFHSNTTAFKDLNFNKDGLDGIVPLNNKVFEIARKDVNGYMPEKEEDIDLPF
jgi:replicative DNA helicase